MKNILVFPCGSEIALEIYNSVKYSTYFHLIGASSTDDHGKFVYKDYISGLPYVTDPEILPALKKIICERKIDAIYPTMDLVITTLKGYEKELGCPVVGCDLETTKICLSKRKTYHMLKGLIRLPHIYDAEEVPVDAYPVFVKPDIGYGARGTRKIKNQEEMDACLEDAKKKLVLEYLPGKEYTVDCFTDRYGVLRYSAARVRHRIKSGISVNTFFVKDQEEFRRIISVINDNISFRGPWFAQFKRSKDGQLCLMEIAARLGGSSALDRAIGVNFSQLALFDCFDYDVEINTNDYEVVLDRALGNKYSCRPDFDTVYIDYDDCLILNKKDINCELIRFLYQCINEKKRLILLTKHLGDLKGELSDFRLDHLFDEVIHINPEDRKVDHIKAGKFIFIDDSFAERKRVQDAFQAPVFSPEMVETLLH